MLSTLVRTVSNARTLLPRAFKQVSPGVISYSHNCSPALVQEVLPTDSEIRLITSSTIDKVNQQVAQGNEGRLFAVVHVAGKQFKITAEDIVIIEGYWPPTNGDQLNLEKVLLVGGTDFTLIGRPILPQGLVSVRATIIAKELSHQMPIFFMKRRKQYKRLNLFRAHYTMMRINEIAITRDINQNFDTEQVERIRPR